MKKKAPLKVLCIREGGLTAGRVSPGDRLVSINGHSIRDVIDFYFYSAEEILEMTFLRNNAPFELTLERTYGDDIGLEFETMQYQHCGNHCVFCFVDQNPENMRQSLYFKDEDFRLSFLYGNYVTLTNIGDEELERIVEQRLSPLYVSIHSVNPGVRKKMLGLKKDDHLLEKIQYLIRHGIEMHGQVVLCPGWNDKAVLDETVEVLSGFFPDFRTLAVVPLGLTRHRAGLTELTSVTPSFSRQVIDQIQIYQSEFEEKLDEPFVYLADEFYLQAEQPLPNAEHYREFWQIENGVGMMRDFLDAFDAVMQSAPKAVKNPIHWIWATGQSAGPVLAKEVMPYLNQIGNLQAELCVVENHLMGSSVTVSGLLSGQDFYEALHPVTSDVQVLLPPNCVNEDGVFLDDWTPEILSEKLSCHVHVVYSLDELWKLL